MPNKTLQMEYQEKPDWEEELRGILDDVFPKLNSDNPKEKSPNNRSAALVMHAKTVMLVHNLLSQKEKEIENILLDRKIRDMRIKSALRHKDFIGAIMAMIEIPLWLKEEMLREENKTKK